MMINHIRHPPTGSSLKLRAGTAITLKPGFSAKSGSTFSAKLVAYENCSTNHGRPANVEETKTPEGEVIAGAGIQVFPNPTTGQLTVLAPTAIASIHLMDLTGKTLLSQTSIHQEELHLTLEMPSGIYLLLLTDETGTVFTHKIIKQ